MNKFMREHWDKVFSNTEDNELGWYEEFPEPTVKMLQECSLNKDDLILIVGAGTASFVDYSIKQNYKNIIVTDISQIALNKLKERLGNNKSNRVNFIIDDITEADELIKLRNISLWYDRAVLHFFTEEVQRQQYFSLLKKVLKKGGYVIIAVFSLAGAKKCSGLDVVNYDHQTIQKYLGDEFILIKYFDYLFHTPSGDTRPYIYTLFQKK